MRKLALCALTAMVVSLAAPVQAGPSTSGMSVAFARVELSDSDRTVTAFGGKGTKSVETGVAGNGVLISFRGKYPKNLTTDMVLVQATAEASDGAEFTVANAIVSIVSPTQIVIAVKTYNPSTLAIVDGNVSVNVFVGR
jgi:hypothetical protein